MEMTILDLEEGLQQLEWVKAGLVILNQLSIPFQTACALTAQQLGMSIEEAKTRIEYWETLSGIRLDRANEN